MKKRNFLIIILTTIAIAVWAQNLMLIKTILEYRSESTTTSTTSSTTVFVKKDFNLTIITSCQEDADCKLVSVNCCPEEAGALWKCINVKESIIDCPLYVVCPQILSEKPAGKCVCENGECVLR